MKKISLLPALMIVSAACFCQNKVELELKNLIVPSSPAFSLLDFNPKTIERPGTIKALALNIVNQTGESAGIPKNFALEFSPYWFFKHPDMSIYKYNGITAKEDGSGAEKQNIFSGLRSTSISFGSVFKDSSKALPVDVNYIAYGIRANLISVRNKRLLDSMVQKIVEINKGLTAALAAADCKDTKGEDLEGEELRKCLAEKVINGLKKDTKTKEAREQYVALLNVRPWFSVDAALASSIAFGDNSFSRSKSYRTGGWLTLSFSKSFTKGKELEKVLNAKNYINAYGMFRLLNENSTKDFNSFKKHRFLDAGARIEFEFDKFSCSFETIHRTNKNDKSLNGDKTVGIIQYRVAESIYLLGTFGKDFEKVKNLIALLGINLGFGSNSIFQKFKP